MMRVAQPSSVPPVSMFLKLAKRLVSNNRIRLGKEMLARIVGNVDPIGPATALDTDEIRARAALSVRVWTGFLQSRPRFLESAVEGSQPVGPGGYGFFDPATALFAIKNRGRGRGRVRDV